MLREAWPFLFQDKTSMAKISLCLIVGNVEEYIERCLTSFLPIADEICMVRAIGNQKPDRTLEIAAAGHFRNLNFGEYKNRKGNEGWPHLDDFAAARQMSFDLASGDYLFWCDSDDVLEAGAEIVREHAERGGYACFVYPYRILGRGYMVPRERMVARDSGFWEYPVHEHYKFNIEPVQAIEDERVIIKHMPHLSKIGSSERNLRILEAMEEDKLPTGMLYHKHVELAIAKRIPESVEVAEKLLGREDLGRAERYELFLNIAQVDSDPMRKQQLYLQAYAADPRRREALGLLAVHNMNYQKNESGLAYARAMMSLPPPHNPEWNNRGAVYDWVGDDIYAQALRANGMADQAEQLRKETIKRVGSPRIALIHATRGRPELAAATRKIWIDTANKPELLEHIFVYDEDDEESLPLRRLHHLTLPKGGGCVAAWNHGAFVTEAPVIIQLSDDWIPVPGWDDMILERIGDPGKASVLAISDGLRKDSLLCMAICTRAYLALDHFLFHPFFTGVYSDNWFTEQAYARKAVIEARDIVFTHDHFLKGNREPDKTYREQNAPERYHEGKKVLEYLHEGNDWSSVPGFFNYWHFYQVIAERIKDGDTIAEVGVWLGRSIIFMAQWLKRIGKPNVRIYAVDHFKGESNQKEHEATVRMCGGNIRQAFEANIRRCGVADMIHIIEEDSSEAAKQIDDDSLSFCFIDASHDYESAKKDILAWRPKMKINSILAGHDVDHEPVRRAVEEIIKKPVYIGNVWMEA